MRKVEWLNPSTWAPVLVAWSFFLLLPFGRVSNLSMLLMAIAGGVLLWRGGRALISHGPYRLFGLLFLCIWLPVVASVPDSVRFDRSLTTALLFPYVYLAGVFLIYVFQHDTARQRLLRLVAWMLVFWVADVLIQAVAGVDLFGYEPKRDRLQGPFGEDSLNMGIVLAMLAPMLFAHAYKAWPRWTLWVVVLGVTAAIMLSATRTAWVIYALALIGSFVFIGRDAGLRLWRWAAVALLGIAVIGFVAHRTVPVVADRLQQTLLVMDGSFEKIDAASSLRLTLWMNALRIIEENPVNGVGIHAFRYAYPQYAPPDDVMLSVDAQGEVTGALYAHQIVLEVLSETGIIGLAGLVVFYVLMLRYRNGQSEQVTVASWPFWLGAMAWLFPLSTHTSFYGTYWGHIIWCLVAVAVAGRSACALEIKQNVYLPDGSNPA